MACPRKSSKKVPHRQADLSNLSTEVLRLHLQAHNLPITGSRSQLLRTLRAARSGSTSPLNTRPCLISGQVQKHTLALVGQEPHHTRIFLPNTPPLQQSLMKTSPHPTLGPRWTIFLTTHLRTNPWASFHQPSWRPFRKRSLTRCSRRWHPFKNQAASQIPVPTSPALHRELALLLHWA